MIQFPFKLYPCFAFLSQNEAKCASSYSNKFIIWLLILIILLQIKVNLTLHCCVPLCTSDSRYNPELHFHHIPKNPELKRQWIIKIRRDEGPLFNVSSFSLSIFLQFSNEINCFSNQTKPKVIDLSLFSFSQNLP